jgi:hypothetical protein
VAAAAVAAYPQPTLLKRVVLVALLAVHLRVLEAALLRPLSTPARRLPLARPPLTSRAAAAQAARPTMLAPALLAALGAFPAAVGAVAAAVRLPAVPVARAARAA